MTICNRFGLNGFHDKFILLSGKMHMEYLHSSAYIQIKQYTHIFCVYTVCINTEYFNVMLIFSLNALRQYHLIDEKILEFKYKLIKI